MEFDLSLIDKEVQKKLYDDLLKGTLQNTGRALETVSEFAFTPLFLLRLANQASRKKFERAMLRLESEFSEHADTERVLPPIEIAEPILEEIVRVEDNQISDMFVKLLANASLNSSKGKVHRAFIATLKEMVPDEARILEHIKENRFVPVIQFMLDKYIPLSDRHCGLESKLNLAVPESIALYMENLVRLGVIERFDGLIYSGSDKMYSELIASYSHDGIAHAYKFDTLEPFKERERAFWTRGHYKLTPYGKSFRAACCVDQ
ncbi:MAG: DUF4393 domain-containing protein [Verrucomicrobiales bacterium]|nr:DUF4393 domain-containing protein [Verrucomicrobiales bacterium]